MQTILYITMAFGAVLAILGVVLFAKKGAQGSNTVKMLGFEFQLTGSSLVIFVVGVTTFLYPLLKLDKFIDHDTATGGNGGSGPPLVTTTNTTEPVGSTGGATTTPSRSTVRQIRPVERPSKTHAEIVFEQIKELPHNGDSDTRLLMELEIRETMRNELEKRGMDSTLSDSLDVPSLERLARARGIIR